MKTNTKRIIFSILIILNCLTIFYFSHQIADNSSKQSGAIVEIISNIIPCIKNMPEEEQTILKEEILAPIVRKSAHFSIYTMLGILTTNFMLTIENKKMSKRAIIALIFCILYAITDEFHQKFIPGRSAELRDVLIDTSGAMLGILLTIAVTLLTRKIKNRKEMLENKS